MDTRKPNDDSVNAGDLWNHTDKKTRPMAEFFWKKEQSEKPLANAAAAAAKNAKSAAFVTLPVITGMGIAILGSRIGGFSLAPLGLPIAVGGVVLDTVKAPFTLAIATEEGVRAGITKLTSLIFEQHPDEQQVKRIFGAFLQRMQETATILIALGLEEQDVLDKKLKSGDIEDLVGLTLLHTAYVSRNSYSSLLLSTEKTLDREHCPPQGLPLFDKIMELKKSIRLALDSSGKVWPADEKDRQLEESRIVCQWIRLIKAGKPLTVADKPDATEQQLALVNKIIAQIKDLQLHGMKALPQTPAEVVSHLRRPGR